MECGESFGRVRCSGDEGRRIAGGCSSCPAPQDAQASGGVVRVRTDDEGGRVAPQPAGVRGGCSSVSTTLRSLHLGHFFVGPVK